MKEVYDENNKMVKETKEIIDVMQQKQQDSLAHLDKKQETIINHIQQLETDFKIQIDRHLKELENTDLRQQKELADLSEYCKKLKTEIIDLGTHIGTEISKVINTTNSTLNDYGRKIGDVELNVKKQLDDIMTKFQYYNKDFTNISENF